MKKSQVEVKCFRCRKPFIKRRADYNRTEREGGRHFCCRGCSIAQSNSDSGFHGDPNRIAQYAGNNRDEFTSFKWFLFRVKDRCRGGKRENGIDLEYLKQLWDEQKGICPVTGWNMILPPSTYGWKGQPRVRRASLDRIDSSKGYIKGNVRFVIEMANFAKNQYTTNELYEFCRAVSIFHP